MVKRCVATFAFDFGQVQHVAVGRPGLGQVQRLLVRAGLGPSQDVGNVVGRGRPGGVAVHVGMPRAGHRRLGRRHGRDHRARQVHRRLPVAAVHHHQHFIRIASHRRNERRADGGDAFLAHCTYAGGAERQDYRRTISYILFAHYNDDARGRLTNRDDEYNNIYSHAVGRDW